MAERVERANTETALSKHEDNLEAKSSGSNASNDNHMSLAEPSAVKNTSKCDEIVENHDVIRWMTAKEPAESYWKELAEERGNALEETLRENEKLCKTVNVLNTKIDYLNKILDSQKEIILKQHSIIEELTEGIDE